MSVRIQLEAVGVDPELAPGDLEISLDGLMPSGENTERAEIAFGRCMTPTGTIDAAALDALRAYEENVKP
jgi:hypothetical protein